MGLSRETWPLESDTTQVLGYPPLFYPGVVEPTEAQRVKVGVGQEVGNIDFALVPARTARVSGTVVNAAGAPVANESRDVVAGGHGTTGRIHLRPLDRSDRT